MFSFHSKTHCLADLLEGYYDIHCHLMPGVDDGSPNSEHSINLLNRMQGYGVKGLYMTPHIINGAYGNRDETALRKAFAEFGYDGSLDVRLAAEYFVDDVFLSRLKGEPLTMKDNYILTEFSMNGYSIRWFDMLFEATIAGYEVILAHPERYSFVQTNGRDKAINLIKQHKLQLNLLSLAGFHGSNAKKCAEQLLLEGLYTFVGSDTHSNAYLDVLERTKVPNKLFEVLKILRENNQTLF